MIDTNLASANHIIGCSHEMYPVGGLTVFKDHKSNNLCLVCSLNFVFVIQNVDLMNKHMNLNWENSQSLHSRHLLSIVLFRRFFFEQFKNETVGNIAASFDSVLFVFSSRRNKQSVEIEICYILWHSSREFHKLYISEFGSFLQIHFDRFGKVFIFFVSNINYFKCSIPNYNRITFTT